MKAAEIRERLTKAQAEIGKKLVTIDKKTLKIEKLTNELKDKYNLNIAGCKTDNEKEQVLFKSDIVRDSEPWFKAYWTICDIEHLEDDIKSLYQKITEKEATIKKYEDALYKAEAIENIFENEIPESMKQMQTELVEEWDRFDKERREFYRAKYRELEYREFMRKYSFAAYQRKNETDDEIHNRNVRDAKTEILDLYNRVKEITGEVTDWSHIRLTSGNSFPVLNGYVKGVKGAADVESILAGGYNIQRLHVRTLIHAR